MKTKDIQLKLITHLTAASLGLISGFIAAMEWTVAIADKVRSHGYSSASSQESVHVDSKDKEVILKDN